MTRRPFSGHVRLPAPTPQEDTGFPVTVLDAAGRPLATLTARQWRAAHVERACVHGQRYCLACRGVAARRVPAEAPRERVSDTALLAALAASA